MVGLAAKVAVEVGARLIGVVFDDEEEEVELNLAVEVLVVGVVLVVVEGLPLTLLVEVELAVEDVLVTLLIAALLVVLEEGTREDGIVEGLLDLGAGDGESVLAIGDEELVEDGAKEARVVRVGRLVVLDVEVVVRFEAATAGFSALSSVLPEAVAADAAALRGGIISREKRKRKRGAGEGGGGWKKQIENLPSWFATALTGLPSSSLPIFHFCNHDRFREWFK